MLRYLLFNISLHTTMHCRMAKHCMIVCQLNFSDLFRAKFIRVHTVYPARGTCVKQWDAIICWIALSRWRSCSSLCVSSCTLGKSGGVRHGGCNWMVSFQHFSRWNVNLIMCFRHFVPNIPSYVCAYLLLGLLKAVAATSPADIVLCTACVTINLTVCSRS